MIETPGTFALLPSPLRSVVGLLDPFLGLQDQGCRSENLDLVFHGSEHLLSSDPRSLHQLVRRKGIER